MKIVKCILLFLFIFTLLGCGNDPVKLVKTSLKLDKSVTVGDAFEAYKYLQNKKWISFETNQKKLVAEFSGVVDVAKYEGLKRRYKSIDQDDIKNVLEYIN